ncbi:MAG: heavy metal translocating P-type ATPase [Treponema sp.]|nr:heavy metal translocating P-type ATPase [Treponema sp.]
MESKIIKIGGMSCAACSARIEKSLSNLKGIKSAGVNLTSETAAIVFDQRIIKLQSIKDTITSLGYEVIEESEDEADEDKLRKEKEIKTLKIKLIISAAFTLPLLYAAMVPMISWLPLPFPVFLEPMQFPLLYALVQLALTIPVIAAGNRFYTSGFKNLLRRSPNMDSLIAAGTAAAFIYSIFNLFQITRGNQIAVHSLYFETAAAIITLILLGKTLEAVTKGRTGEAIKKLMSLSPKTAIVIENGQEKEIPVNKIKQGDIIIIKPGSKIPADGIITEGYSALDESMLTGESIPVDKKPGDSVFGGTVNCSGSFRFKAEKTGSQTALAQIIKLVQDAQGSKAPIARMADIVSGYFVPIVCIIALLAGLLWFAAVSSGLISILNPADHQYQKSILEFSLTIFISVLVIACPCALGLATPVAVMTGTGRGAQNGILIKSGLALEIAGKIHTVVFDKTGTITEGKPEVTDIVEIRNEKPGIINEGQIPDEYCLLQLAAAAEKSSEHPLGQAIVREAEKRGLSIPNSKGFKAIPGLGIEVSLSVSDQNYLVLIGNIRLMHDKNIESVKAEIESERLSLEGKTPVFAAINGKIAGIIAVADVIKKNSRLAVEKLIKMGIDVVMITGDNKQTADAIANESGIKTVYSEVLPHEKQNIIKALQSDNKKVAMAGDGINDAPSLAQADIGIAIGSGTDVAIEAADIVLMRNDPMDVTTAINLSRKTISIIKQNLFWAFGYNVLGIPIAAGVLFLFGGPLLNPMFAAAAMSLSSVSVLLNALRLKKVKIN